jgi:hypothetical protein
VDYNIPTAYSAENCQVKKAHSWRTDIQDDYAGTTSHAELNQIGPFE